MQINGVNNKCFIKPSASEKSSEIRECIEQCTKNFKTPEIQASCYKANFAPTVTFSEVPHQIKSAVIVTSDGDVPIQPHNGSFLIDKTTGSALIYGKKAVNHLKKNLHYDFDTQVVFPKGATGSVLTSNGKKIKLKENSAVMINAGTDVKIVPDSSSKAYPVIISQKTDYPWYERYGSDAQTEPVKNKYSEIAELNSHFFNGAFSTDFLLPESLTGSSVWNDKTGIGPAWKAKGKMLEVLNGNRDKLNDNQVEELDKVNKFVQKLHKNNILEYEDNGYVKFRFNFVEPYQSAILKDHGLTDEETQILMPLCDKMRIAKQNSAVARRDRAEAYPKETVPKLKEAGLIFDTKKDDGFIYWKTPVDNIKLLEQQLIEAGFTSGERHQIIDGFNAERKSGMDFSGHKYSDDGIAVYELGEKVNNWSLEETNHVTNATAPSSSEGKTQSIGVSLVQFAEDKTADISEIRKGEQLHSHPNRDDAKQSEVYLITRGSAALGIRQNGELKTKILNAGELAVIEPGVEHFVSAVKGEYEHVVVQVPSAFQYGFGFKQTSEVSEDELSAQKIEAFKLLGPDIQVNGDVGMPEEEKIYRELPNAASDI